MSDLAMTFPHILIENAKKFPPSKVAMREKDYGIWQSYSWQDYLEQVRDFALGLASLGFKKDDKMAIIGDNRPQLYWGLAACQCLGGVPVPLYQDAIHKELHYIVDHSECRFSLAEDQEQTDKLMHLKDEIPRMEYIIYDDPRGLQNYKKDWLLAFTDVQEMGRKFGRENPDYFMDAVNQVKPDDMSIIGYTSGTTGNPKGVMITHRMIADCSRGFLQWDNLDETEEVMAYLPMAWIGDHIFSYGQALCAGFTVNCPESTATVVHDQKEIGPTHIFAPPRIWENILTQIMIKIEDSAWIKRKGFDYFMKVAARVEKKRIANEQVPFGDRILYQIGRFLFYAPLVDNLGMRKIKVAYTAGEAIGPEIFEFYRSLGVNLKQLYGMTESCAYVSMQKDGEIDSDSVGPPAPGVKIKISETGEVLYKSPGNFLGYYKNPEATAETLEDGWLHSGDAGYMTEQGHLKIIDRAKDVNQLNDGTMFAPKYIENKLKFSPYIKEAVAHGMNRDYVAVFIDIDYGAVANWAERRHIAFTSYTDLAQKPPVYDLIQEAIHKVNRSLAEDPRLKNSQIKKYLLFHKELNPDDGEITRTRKVRRKFIAEKYGNLIEALYDPSKESVDVEATITYEDGRTTTMRASLKIRDAETF
ncbi:MAG: AMP-binding protein [Deltaproteobacteria bacterium]|nr:AMP-binding protein [Deltaproteobacteria bacterium]MBW2048512.1 AMP-binding protein [Deltaproteobacteria bacterium]MBW2111918.1 AMP-binding protein [Deltaproteobacteria bacterium]MBW2353661.1 AMP-binding protein [Deltaproteobacteria bacterium]HDZ90216.1 long-chain fatty acid--CoA ligase [Deltaproteobacteria bacterium]